MNIFDKMEDFLGSEEAAKDYMAKNDPRKHDDQIQMLFESPTIQDLFIKEEFIKVKSQVDGKRFRDLGNEAYKHSQDIKALELYNRSCQASTNDFELALALANRSAAALRLQKFDTALKNVNWAIQIGTYPQENIYKLHERRAKIYFQLNRLKEASSEYLKASSLVEDVAKASEMTSLSKKCFESNGLDSNCSAQNIMEKYDFEAFDKNEGYPGFSKKVDIRFEENRGRFGVAVTDIDVGEIIGVEEPVVSRLTRGQEQSHCHYCFMYLEDSCFLPCLNCVDAKFCSLDCRSGAMKTHHKYECGLTASLEDMLVKIKSKSAQIVDYYRLGYRAISQKPMEYFRESYKDLIHSTSSHPSKRKVFLSQDYSSLSSLVDNYKNADVNSNIWPQISACFIIRSLREKGYFGEVSAKKVRSKVLTNDERIIANLSRYFLQIFKYNNHGIIECLSYKNTNTGLFANGIYTNIALLNHSCAPNVTKYFLGNKMYLLASSPVPKGVEISENYFPYFYFMGKDQRINWLRDHYCFDCCCDACSKEYPILTQMESSSSHSYLCPKCKKALGKNKDSKDGLFCAKCSETFLKQNLKNDIVGLMDELVHRFESKSAPDQLLEIGKSLVAKVTEPDPFLYKFQKLYTFSLQFARGNKQRD